MHILPRRNFTAEATSDIYCWQPVSMRIGPDKRHLLLATSEHADWTFGKLLAQNSRLPTARKAASLCVAPLARNSEGTSPSSQNKLRRPRGWSTALLQSSIRCKCCTINWPFFDGATSFARKTNPMIHQWSMSSLEHLSVRAPAVFLNFSIFLSFRGQIQNLVDSLMNLKSEDESSSHCGGHGEKHRESSNYFTTWPEVRIWLIYKVFPSRPFTCSLRCSCGGQKPRHLWKRKQQTTTGGVQFAGRALNHFFCNKHLLLVVTNAFSDESVAAFSITRILREFPYQNT